MPILSITKTYLNGNILTETDLDNIRNSITTFFNTTGIDSTNIQAGGILGSNIANSTITATQIAAGTINTAQIASSAITTVLIAPGAVGQNQRAALGQQLSSNTITQTITGVTSVQITNASVSIPTTGRAVFMGLVGNSLASGLSIVSGSPAIAGTISFNRDSTVLSTHLISSNINSSAFFTASAFNHFDTSSTGGTHTYSAVVGTSGGGTTVTVTNVALLAFEL